MGRGDQRLYAYSFPMHMNSGQTYYPIKVGMTSRESAPERILEQLNASNSEPAHLLIEVSCDNALKLEKRMHRRLNERRVLDAPGKEWYRTNVDELLKELRSIDPALRETKEDLLVYCFDISMYWLTKFLKGLGSVLYWIAEASSRQMRKKTKRRLGRSYRKAEELFAKGVAAVVLFAFLFVLSLFGT